MKRQRLKFLGWSSGLLLWAVGLGGCIELGFPPDSSSPTSPPSQTDDDSSTSADPPPGSSSENPPSEEASQPTRGENLFCQTPTYFAEMLWQDGRPRLSVGQSVDDLWLKRVPASLSGRTDGSTVYTVEEMQITSVQLYSDGTCTIRVVATDGNVTIYEEGNSEPLGDRPPLVAEVETPDSPPEEDSQANEPDDLSMVCVGTIQQDVDFTVQFTREWGFYRIEFRPRTSNTVLTANLSYSEENQAGQPIWRGNVNGMADVVLVHLSSTIAQPGDQVSVGYDGRWGRASCE